MSVHLTFEGLPELMNALRALPEDLATEAMGIIENTVSDTAMALRSAYPDRAESLRRGVKAKVTRDKVSVVGRVSSTARTPEGISLALLYEIGTQARHTDIGANRGSMPAKPTAVPLMERHKRALYDRLRQLLRDHGLEVTG